MKFGMFYEIQVPKPWYEDKEFEIYQQVLDQAQLADEVGFDSFWTVDRLMWGSDYPHTEGTFPYSQEQIMKDFMGVPETEVYQMVRGNAAQLYGLDI
jgi:predicted TIM-barrel fold metal-dependent hydrolase